jgi:hypothetical protein
MLQWNHRRLAVVLVALAAVAALGGFADFLGDAASWSW